MITGQRRFETGIESSTAILPNPPAHWSFSSLKEVGTCPRRYALFRASYPDLWDRRGYPQIPAPAALFEDIVHNALDTIVKAIAAAGCESAQSPEAVTVLRKLGRYAFIPEATREEAYEAENAVVTKRDADGTSLSSVSAARIQAFMLKQAKISKGMNVLEIGSGGYNAALIAELVGPNGAVTTIDIDPDVTDRARHLLSAAGYEHVNVITGDGGDGAPDRAPFDRIIVTVEATALALAGTSQPAANGRVMVPLRFPVKSAC